VNERRLAGANPFSTFGATPAQLLRWFLEPVDHATPSYSAAHQPDDEQDYGDDQKNVEERSGYQAHEQADQPDNQEDNRN
jgi:hypothetical protein